MAFSTLEYNPEIEATRWLSTAGVFLVCIETTMLQNIFNNSGLDVMTALRLRYRSAQRDAIYSTTGRTNNVWNFWLRYK